MKRSNSTSMVAELLNEMDRERCIRRRNSIGSNMKDTEITNNALNSVSSTMSNTLVNSPPLFLMWSSPVKPVLPLSSPLPLARINSPTSRVIQLRKEESVDERLREAEQDREVTTQIQLNQSWNELKLDDDDGVRPEMMETLPCPVAMTTGIQFTSPSSPVISSRVRSRSLTPTSPSTCRTFNYYLSPAPLRPSSLVLQPQRKRQRNSDQTDDMDISPTHIHPPAKRAVFQSRLNAPPTSCTSPLLTTQPPSIDIPAIISNKPAFDIPQFNAHPHNHTSSFAHSYNHASSLSYGHTPSLPYGHTSSLSNSFSGIRKHAVNHTHQNIESAFFPFTNGNNSNNVQQPDNDDESDNSISLIPVTTLS